MRWTTTRLAVVLLWALPTFAQGATFAVNGTADAVDAAIGDGTCQTAAGTCTLRAAVQEANAQAGSDTIQVPPGTYVLSLSGTGEDAAATGDLDVASPLTVEGADMATTIVDGAGADRVFQVLAGQTFTASGLTVRNGVVGGAAGGGILFGGGATLSLTDVTLASNRADDGAALIALNAPATLTRVHVLDNIATGDGIVLLSSAAGETVAVHDGVFARNLAPSGSGGGLVASTSGTVTVTGTTFRDNLASAAGDLLVAGASSTTVTDSTFDGSMAMGSGNGGCILVTGSGAVTLERASLQRCTAFSTGGGGLISTAGPVVVRGVTVADCVAASTGGGLYVATTTSVLVEDGTFSGNLVGTGTGGGLYVAGGGTADAQLVRVTATDNHAGLGAGMLVTVPGDVLVDAGRITGNAALASMTGGVYVSAGGAVTVRDTAIADNLGGTVAGGGYLTAAGAVSVERSVIARNAALAPGAIAGGLFVSGGVGTAVTNCTFSGNASQLLAGGLYLVVPGTVSNCSFSGNAAGQPGAALVATAGATLRANAIASGDVASCAPAPVLTSDGFNVDQDGSCGLALASDRSGIDPMLGPLADNGGPTLTHEPLAGSPLIEGAGSTCPAVDQRGIARPQDADGDGTAACDVGAVEYVDACPADPQKRVPGACGCGVPDVDANANGAFECQINAELKARIATARTTVQGLTGDRTPEQDALRAQLATQGDDLLSYCKANDATIVKATPSASLTKLAKKVRKALRAARRGAGPALARKQAKATKALDALDAAVAPQP